MKAIMPMAIEASAYLPDYNVKRSAIPAHL